VNHYDYHATLMHLLGITPTEMSFTRPTGVGSLIDGQDARIVWDILEQKPS
jgi:hypothetical protein